MVVNFPRKKLPMAIDLRMQQLILSILAGVERSRIHVAPVACWLDCNGRLKPAHALPEAA